MSRQFAVDRDRARQGAFYLEFLNFPRDGQPEDLALASGKWGEALRRHVETEFGHTVGIRVYCEQLPDHRNSVVLNPQVRTTSATLRRTSPVTSARTSARR